MQWPWNRKSKPARIYLDHAASTPLRPAVWEAMVPWLRDAWGNASAIHEEGRLARKAVESARSEVAKVLAIRPDGVVFTPSGTTANNLAIIGYCTQLVESGRAWSDMEVLTTAIEHPSVRESCAELRRRGVMVRELPVTNEGVLLPETLKAALTSKTVLVTLAYANSEVGTIQPVHALARVLRHYEREHAVESITLHVDAAQAPLWLPCDLPRLGADLLTLDGAKCGGPKGVGVLALRKGAAVRPVLWGGGQERGLWSGTENVAGIVGMGTALALAQAGVKERSYLVRGVRDAAMTLISNALPQAVVIGPHGEGRIANNINISLPGHDTEYAVVVLDTSGIAASTKSACAGAGGGESAVVLALTSDPVLARSTIRFSLGEETTIADFEKVIAVLAKFLEKQSKLT